VTEEEDGVDAETAALFDASFNQGGAYSSPLILRLDSQGPERHWFERVRGGGPDGKGAEEHMADHDLIDAGNELEEDATVGAERVEQGIVPGMAEGPLVDAADGGEVNGLRSSNYRVKFFSQTGPTYFRRLKESRSQAGPTVTNVAGPGVCLAVSCFQAPGGVVRSAVLHAALIGSSASPQNDSAVAAAKS
jgi:hypothetical protein